MRRRVLRCLSDTDRLWQPGPVDQSAWPEVLAAVAAAPYPVQVLPADTERATTCSEALGISTRSWLGAVVANTGGLLVDHGWVRVLGCGHDRLPDIVTQADTEAGVLTVGFDVLGGQFVWIQVEPGTKPTVHYFGPDDLGWQDLEQGYAEWLNAILRGSLNRFYETLRWPGWQTDVGALGIDQGFSVWPPPFTKEGSDLSAVSRKAIPMAQLVSFYHDAARQLGEPTQ
ncbi:hypothetical protein Vlu01_45430 [Micromonospora lutea]|uniref:DUF2625 domain-containing protein n=1 Tax=Micromonospora lutea TaxID=419825 RepID=A0ABQ4J186_9ACTN|nr:hypothetical protein Vlu01_45430 [Micromonospora lutea]